MGQALADHTTLRLGGAADQWLTHTDPATWHDIVRAVPEPPLVLGGGSNLLADDAGYPGPVICIATRGITTHRFGDGTMEITAQAGEQLADVVAYSVSEGLSGIECLGGIPGTIGAAPVQNAGAYGQQIADHLVAVTAWDWRSGCSVRLTPDACAFRYRTSVFKQQPRRWTLLSVTLCLERSDRSAPVTYGYLAQALDVEIDARPPLAETAAGVIADRAARGLLLPDGGPDARQVGSVFMNPPVTWEQARKLQQAGGRVFRDSDDVTRAGAGWLLEHCGYRPGQRVEQGVYCSTRRTLTVTARNGATCASYRHALFQMAERVWEVTGIRLEPEPVQPTAPSTGPGERANTAPAL
ncbi:UDP-N-acetylmuramate dehydrogenase [Streptomyces sp. NPDC052051]|uniref:UDP-N-acetylmuramate dehydrogenase n=1 Tax=Streptomyces sp. NPDC052051 TaxID=3154649 RepID=UPI003417456A